jgi:NAD(P)H-hydrate epimerase
MIEVDRAMVEDYRIELVQMMENAGRNLAHLARVRFLGGDPLAMSVVVLAGTGGNGGGAMVCARRLRNWGATVQVFVSRVAPPGGGARTGDRRDHRLHLERVTPRECGSPDRMGQWMSCASAVPRRSLGCRQRHRRRLRAGGSGFGDHDAGTSQDGTRSVTSETEQHVGELYLADISVPPDLYRQYLGIDVPVLFADSEVVSLR